MKKDIILIGAGGHCRSCIDVIEKTGEYSICGILDAPEKRHQTILGYEIIGTDNDLPQLTKSVMHFAITVGQIKSPAIRKNLFTGLKNLNARLPVITSPLSYVSPHASVGEGTVVLHSVVINAGAQVGCNCIINSKSLIEHDATVGNHCHISTGAVLNGDVAIGDECFIGSNAIISESRKICSSVVIGAGSVLLNDIVNPGTYFGNPARKAGSR